MPNQIPANAENDELHTAAFHAADREPDATDEQVSELTEYTEVGDDEVYLDPAEFADHDDDTTGEA